MIAIEIEGLVILVLKTAIEWLLLVASWVEHFDSMSIAFCSGSMSRSFRLATDNKYFARAVHVEIKMSKIVGQESLRGRCYFWK